MFKPKPDLHLDTSIQSVKYVGPKTIPFLEAKSIYVVQDLWNYFPYRYENTTNIINISEILPYIKRYAFLNIDSLPKIVLRGILIKKQQFRTARGMIIITAEFKDIENETTINAIWFNQKFLHNSLLLNRQYIIYGKFKKQGSTLQLQSPEIELYKSKLVHLGRYTPIYSQIKKVSSKYLRRLLVEIRSTVDEFKEFIPTNILEKYDLTQLNTAYQYLHFPENAKEIKQGYERLAIQELLELLHTYHQTKPKRKTTKFSLEKIPALKSILPFQLTKDQLTVYKELLQLSSRGTSEVLIYGDVGSGKTIVFYLTALHFLLSNYNVILMAPTTILANQHFNTIKELLELLPAKYKKQINLELITSTTSKRKNIKVEKPTLLIGTHALLFKNFQLKHAVGLIGIDEQHKFGTEQREQLIHINKVSKETKKKLDTYPIIVTMSATPIPRTLALTFYGYQKALYIKTRPQHQKPVKTFHLEEEKLPELFDWIKKEMKTRNTQSYIVFPNINGAFNEYGAIAWFESLKETVFKDYNVQLLHGGLKENEKNNIIKNFEEGKINILFTTSIIEVGIDIHKANILVIIGANHFGLSQLHQLRGRIGRGAEQGYCFVVDSKSDRLKYFAKHHNGLDLARFDLKTRGPGDIIKGINQSGYYKLKLADINNLYLVNKSVNIFKDIKHKVKLYINKE